MSELIDIRYVVDARFVSYLARRELVKGSALHWHGMRSWHMAVANVDCSISDVWPGDCVCVLDTPNARYVSDRCNGDHVIAAKRIRQRIVAVMPDVFTDSTPDQAQVWREARRYNPHAYQKAESGARRRPVRADDGRRDDDDRASSVVAGEASAGYSDAAPPPY